MSFYVAAPPPGEHAVHPVDEVLPPVRLGIYGAQHVLAFYAGAVIVPILLAGAIGLRGQDLVRAGSRRSSSQVNGLSEPEFVARFGPIFQTPPTRPPWIAQEAAGLRPFDSLYAMRHALHSVLFDGPADRQRELIRGYPDIAAKVALGQGSRRDQASAGLDRLTPQEYEHFDALNEAYREKFGFPFVICVRENTKETILEEFERRVRNTPVQEQMAALVEIAKIANLRLYDLVEDDIPEVAEEPPRPPALGEPPRFGSAARGDGGMAPAEA